MQHCNNAIKPEFDKQKSKKIEVTCLKRSDRGIKRQ